MVVSAKLVGGKQALQKLDKLSKTYPLAFVTAIYREALRIFVQSQLLVPVDTGRLRASGGVTPPTSTGTLIVIYYGTVYAGVVHETHPTKAKYLETPYLAAMNGLVDRVEKDTLAIWKKANP